MALNRFQFFFLCVILKETRMYSLTLFENKNFPLSLSHLEKKKM